MKLDQLLSSNQENNGQFKGSVKLIAVSAGVLLVLLVIVAVLATGLSGAREEMSKLRDELAEAQKIDVTYVGNKLETISELATAKMTYNGIVHFSEGKVMFIDKKEFYMYYRVSMKAGIDLSKAEIQVTEHTVTIDLPAVEIYEPIVDETSIEFFDKNFGLFADEEMDDLSQAITKAKEDALAQPETEEMKQTAKDQAIVLITALFEGQIGDRELVINVG